MTYNNSLGYQLVFKLQEKVRIMPTALVATIILLYRKGISQQTLLKQI
jgi:glycerol-3-phosphate O-acyltransferase